MMNRSTFVEQNKREKFGSLLEEDGGKKNDEQGKQKERNRLKHKHTKTRVEEIRYKTTHTFIILGKKNTKQNNSGISYLYLHIIYI